MSDLKIKTQKSLVWRNASTGSLNAILQPPNSQGPSRRNRAAMRELAGERGGMVRDDASVLDHWEPPVDIERCGDNLIVIAELPGLRNQDIHVEICEDMLTIGGERKRELNEEHQETYGERRYGKFDRRIPLPKGAKAFQARAELRNGILRVSVPLPEKKIWRVVVEQGVEHKAA